MEVQAMSQAPLPPSTDGMYPFSFPLYSLANQEMNQMEKSEKMEVPKSHSYFEIHVEHISTKLGPSADEHVSAPLTTRTRARIHKSPLLSLLAPSRFVEHRI
mmetsp:Transcript_24433/g.38344  ORF Transcript_24433/g.38344 Transcript_24433/m.38344 type:complete len:102 (-) Transcript_24433:1020-1325(-)